jgi:hypothetical protein
MSQASVVDGHGMRDAKCLVLVLEELLQGALVLLAAFVALSFLFF